MAIEEEIINDDYAIALHEKPSFFAKVMMLQIGVVFLGWASGVAILLISIFNPFRVLYFPW
jgi:hypothetical protein